MIGSFIISFGFSIYNKNIIEDELKKEMDRAKKSVTDLICTISFLIMLCAYPVFPVILARGTNWIPPEVILSKTLQWPKYGYMLFLSCSSFLGGYTLQIVLKLGMSKWKHENTYLKYLRNFLLASYWHISHS